MIKAEDFVGKEPEQPKEIIQTDEWYYKDITYVTNSHLSEFEKGPKHLLKMYSDIANETRESSSSQDFGDAWHKKQLEPEVFEETFFILDESERPEPGKDFRNAKNRDWKRQQMEIAGEKRILMGSDFERIIEMEKHFKVAAGSKWLQGMRAEHVHTKNIILPSGRSVMVKCKTDADSDDLIIDLKTSKNPVSFPYFKETFLTYNYDRQMAFYKDVTGAKQVWIFATETKDPYSTAIYQISDESLEIGRQKYINLLEEFVSFKESKFDVNALNGGMI